MQARLSPRSSVRRTFVFGSSFWVVSVAGALHGVADGHHRGSYHEVLWRTISELPPMCAPMFDPLAIHATSSSNRPARINSEQHCGLRWRQVEGCAGPRWPDADRRVGQGQQRVEQVPVAQLQSAGCPGAATSMGEVKTGGRR